MTEQRELCLHQVTKKALEFHTTCLHRTYIAKDSLDFLSVSPLCSYGDVNQFVTFFIVVHTIFFLHAVLELMLSELA